MSLQAEAYIVNWGFGLSKLYDTEWRLWASKQELYG
jgi:hypothetical protein